MATPGLPLSMFDELIRRSADDVDHLALRLEQAIDPDLHRLLHQFRLAAEQLGAMRALAPRQCPR
jgi:hypothetical protein